MHFSPWILLAVYFSPFVAAFYPYKVEEKAEAAIKADGNVARRFWIPDWNRGGQHSDSAAQRLDVPTLSISRRAPPVSSISTSCQTFSDLSYFIRRTWTRMSIASGS